MAGKDDLRLKTPSGEAAPYRVTAGVAAVRTAPEADATLLTQALHGETCSVFDERGEFALVQLDRDNYVGWTDMAALSAPALAPTHRVSALRAYMFSQPDLKSSPHFLVSLNAMVCEEGRNGRYVKCAGAGWIHDAHLSPVGVFEDDPADVATRFAGTPYLWGGRESLGLDCSGLTIAAFSACGVELLRDSDMQFETSGTPIQNWDQPGALKRGDLVFWDGHVGMMLDADAFIHSNAFHMSVAIEPLAGAIERIAPKYGHPTGARRVDLAASRVMPGTHTRSKALA